MVIDASVRIVRPAHGRCAAFVSNILLWSESGYFDPTAALKPLLHLWSLGTPYQKTIF